MTTFGRVGSRIRDPRGATSTEYALLLAFLAVVIVLSVRLFGGVLVDVFSLYPDLTTS
jgi:Flp pilus assembly pilin Flp